MAANPSTKNAHEQLISTLLSNLPAGYTSDEVKLPNRAFTTPKASKWMRPTVIVQDVVNAQAGGLWKRYDGLFVIDTFYPIGGDDLAQLTEAETIAVVFEDVELTGVKCQNALIEVNTIESAWYNVQITIEFYYEG